MSESRNTKAQRTPDDRRRRRTVIAAAAAVVLVLVLAQLLHGNSEERRYERYRHQAAASYQKGDYDQTLSDLRKAEAIRSSEDVLMLMADCYEAQGKWELALETLRRMDRNDATVTERIAAVEQRRMQQQGEGLRVIAGENFPATATELDLRDRDLGNGVLQEVLQLHALTRLSLADNRIDALGSISELGGLRTLDLSGNNIRDISQLGKLSKLHSLNLDGNPLGDLSPLYRLEELGSLSLRGVSLREGELEQLTTILPGCAILTDSDTEDVTSIWLCGTHFDTGASQLSLSGLGLREIQCLSLCSQLRSLDLTNNEISDLSPLMNLQKLEKLRISGNQITDLRPLIGLPALRYLEVTGNAVTETSAVGSLAALQTLDLSDNPIGDFSGLKKLSELQSLRLENTGLADADLEQLYGLKKLNRLALERNDGLTAEAMSALRSALPTCDISFGTLVYTVALGGVDYRTDITELVIENTEMSSIYGLEKFDCLETVRLSRNRIESISAFQNTHSRATIRTLDLGFNQIQDVSPLSALTALESLDLRSNQILSVQSLARLKQLKKLDLSGNPISAEEIEALRAALPECEIVF